MLPLAAHAASRLSKAKVTARCDSLFACLLLHCQWTCIPRGWLLHDCLSIRLLVIFIAGSPVLGKFVNMSCFSVLPCIRLTSTAIAFPVVSAHRMQSKALLATHGRPSRCPCRNGLPRLLLAAHGGPHVTCLANGASAVPASKLQGCGTSGGMAPAHVGARQHEQAAGFSCGCAAARSMHKGSPTTWPRTRHVWISASCQQQGNI